MAYDPAPGVLGAPLSRRPSCPRPRAARAPDIRTAQSWGVGALCWPHPCTATWALEPLPEVRTQVSPVGRAASGAPAGPCRPPPWAQAPRRLSSHPSAPAGPWPLHRFQPRPRPHARTANIYPGERQTLQEVTPKIPAGLEAPQQNALGVGRAGGEGQSPAKLHPFLGSPGPLAGVTASAATPSDTAPALAPRDPGSGHLSQGRPGPGQRCCGTGDQGPQKGWWS